MDQQQIAARLGLLSWSWEHYFLLMGMMMILSLVIGTLCWQFNFLTLLRLPVFIGVYMRRIGLSALLSLSLIGSAHAHNYCHPKEELVLRLNDASGYCRILPDGHIGKITDQATWVLFEYTASAEPRSGECGSGTQYLATDWYYGATCPEQWKLERLQAVRKQLLDSMH